MKGILSTDLSELEAINKKINDFMIDTITNYNAEKWGDIIENPIEKGKFILVINDDSRNPLNAIVIEKIRIVTEKHSDWSKDITKYNINNSK